MVLIVHVTLYSWQVMEKCWKTEPSERPSFTQLKADTHSLLQGDANSTRFIWFPGPNDLHNSETCTYISPIEERSSAQEQRHARERNPTPQRYTPSPSPSDEAPLLDSPNEQNISLELSVSQPLDSESRMRRHPSAPISHRGGEVSRSDAEAVRRRTHSNAYVRTPRHHPDLQVRESFEWNLEPPEAVSITPVITIHVASNDDDEED